MPDNVARNRSSPSASTIKVACPGSSIDAIVAKAINEGPSPEPIARAVKDIIENEDSDIAVMVGQEAEQFVPLRRSLDDKAFEARIIETFGLPPARAERGEGG